MLKAIALGAREAVGLFTNLTRPSQEMFTGLFPGAVGALPSRGTRDFLRAYSTMPWLRAVAHRVSYSVATAEWKVFVARGKAPGAKAVLRKDIARLHDGPARRKALVDLARHGELTELSTHPLLDMLASANSYQTSLAMKKLTQIHLDIVGEGFWWKERNASPSRANKGRGMPVAIWPIPPHWVLSTPTPTNPNYRISYRGWQTTLPDQDVLWFNDPDPEMPYGRGSGFGTSLGDELETDEFIAKHLKAWFLNRARPDLIFSVPGMKDSEMRRTQVDWLNRHQGFWRAFIPFFINREFSVHELDQSFRNQQLVQIREHERNTIVQVWGVPPEKLGILAASNRATITASDLIYNQEVVVPRLEFWRTTLQERLVPEFDERLILDYVSPVQEDKEFHLQVAQAAPWAVEIDEWREMMGREPLKGGKGRLVMVPFQLSPTPVEDLGNEPEPAKPAGVPPELAALLGGKPGEKPEGTPKGFSTTTLARWQVTAKTGFIDVVSPSKGLMVCWPVPKALATTLALPGGESADDLHCTLAYCGPLADLGEVGVAKALVAASRVAATRTPLVGRLSGVATFTPSPSSDGKACRVVLVDVPGLEDLRATLVRSLEAMGVPVMRNHGFTPHITLAYLDRGDPLPEVTLPGDGSFILGVLRVQAGDAHTEFSLGAQINGHQSMPEEVTIP